jgi:2-dehydro-3-deoxygalactonokinase
MMVLAVDSGTTTTRVWALENGSVRVGKAAQAGARDLARGRDRDWLLARIRQLAEETLEQLQREWSAVEAIVAFGMITSELGLEELPHLRTPVGIDDLVDAVQERRYNDSLPVPLQLVPGVRNADARSLEFADFMRGEETEVVGLLSLGRTEPPLLYLSVGSHSKLVAVDGDGRIEWSATTLSGELVWALHRETILAGLIDPTRDIGNLEWVDEGARLVDAIGLSRTLFAARLLNRIERRPAAACSDLVHGAIAQSDLASFRATLAGHGARAVVVAGAGPLAGACRHLLAREPWVDDLDVADEPLGALGAWWVYSKRRERDGLAHSL